MARLFEDRERAEELYFARTEEARFLAHCRAVRRLADYATSKLGVNGDTARAYGDELVGLVAFGTKDAAIVERIRSDLAENGIDVSQAELEAELLRHYAISAQAPTLTTGTILKAPRPF